MSNRIKIIYLIGQLGLGGSERQLYLLLKYLDKDQYEPHVVVLNPSSYIVLNKAMEDVGVQVYQLPDDCTSILQRVRYLYKLIRDITPQIVHSWTLHDNIYAGLVGFLAGVPLRFGSVRSLLSGNSFQRLPLQYRFLSLFSTKTLVLNTTAILAELVERRISPSRTVVIPNCVESLYYEGNKKSGLLDLTEYSIDDTQRVVGLVGNLRSVKNHLMFVDALAEVLPDRPDVKGIIVGQPIPDEPDYPAQIQARLAKHSMNNRVILAGFCDDVPALMLRLTVFCLSSNYEGTPNVILEAMAAGCPVVATRVGGIPDLVRDGVTGYLVDPNDTPGFAQAVKALLDNPDMAKKMGAEGRKVVERDYTCKLAASRLADIYSQALQDR